jgi:hypothetical protein
VDISGTKSILSLINQGFFLFDYSFDVSFQWFSIKSKWRKVDNSGDKVPLLGIRFATSH